MYLYNKEGKRVREEGLQKLATDDKISHISYIYVCQSSTLAVDIQPTVTKIVRKI